MHQFSLSNAWDQTRAILSSEGQLLIAVGSALIVLPQVVLAVAGSPAGLQANPVSQILYVATILLGLIAQVALNRLAIGPSVTVRDAISLGLVRLLSVVGAILLLSIALAVIMVVLGTILVATKLMTLPVAGQPPPAGLVAFVLLLSVLAYALFQLVFPIAAVETGNPFRLISRSWQLGRQHYLGLLAFAILVFIGLAAIGALDRFAIGSVILLLLGPANAGSLSALLLGLVGGVVQAGFTVVTAVMLARLYVQLAGDSDRVAETFR